MSFPSLLLTILCTLVLSNAAVVQNNPVTLELSRFVNATGMRNIVAHDQARAQAMRKKPNPNQSIVNVAVCYTANIGVGKPATDYQLIVDTGSSNIWVGANTPYKHTSTSSDTGEKVSVTYGSGSFSGEEYIDQVTLTPQLVIHKQSIGVASTSKGFSGVDGIIGIGPLDLTLGTLSPDSSSTIPTVTDNLYSNGIIKNHEIGIYFEPATLNSPGELSWGSVDNSKTVGEVTYTPVTSEYPASLYWGIDQAILYGPIPILLPTAGIVDTGTTLILIATDAYVKYVALTGAVPDATTGLLRITPAQYRNLRSLYFVTDEDTFELIPNAQIWPRSLNSVIGGSANYIYLIVADLGSPSGQGLDFINGYAFLERYYSVYDTANSRVGFAATKYTKNDKLN